MSYCQYSLQRSLRKGPAVALCPLVSRLLIVREPLVVFEVDVARRLLVADYSDGSLDRVERALADFFDGAEVPVVRLGGES